METIGISRHAPNAREIAAGTVLFNQGDPASEMYAVVSGQLQVSVNGVEIERVGQDGIVGEMALVNHSPRAATVTAVTDSVVVPITEAEFLGHVHKTPFFALQVLRITTERLRRANQLL